MLNPHTWLIQALQRIVTHSAHDVAQLTQRQWKEHFAASPLTSDIGKGVLIPMFKSVAWTSQVNTHSGQRPKMTGYAAAALQAGMERADSADVIERPTEVYLHLVSVEVRMQTVILN